MVCVLSLCAFLLLDLSLSVCMLHLNVCSIMLLKCAMICAANFCMVLCIKPTMACLKVTHAHIAACTQHC